MSLLVDEYVGEGRDAFFPTFEAQVFGGGGFDRDIVGFKTHDLGKCLPHGGDVGGHFGALKA